MKMNPSGYQFEQELKDRLDRQPDLYAPFLADLLPTESGAGDEGYDTVLRLSYAGRAYTFQVEVKGRSVPSVVRQAIDRLLAVGPKEGALMLAVPYLSADVVSMLWWRSDSTVPTPTGNGVRSGTSTPATVQSSDASS